jgi:hypothetical protein
MKSITVKFVAVIALAAALASFTFKPGGEGFEIYLNGKLWVQQYGTEMNTVKTLSLDNTSPNDQLTLKYHHCGKAALNRVITIRDEKDVILKEFSFENVDRPLSAMTIRLGDITGANKKKGTLKLYYSSTELPKGRMLVSMKPSSKEISRL